MLPKIDGSQIGHIATEPVHICIFYPKEHGIQHGFTHVFASVIKPSHVRPIVQKFRFSVRTPYVPIFMLQPYGIACGVGCHPVHDDTHTQLVGFVYHFTKIFQRAEFLVDSFVVFYGVIRTQNSFPAGHTYGMDGHKPQYINA